MFVDEIIDPFDPGLHAHRRFDGERRVMERAGMICRAVAPDSRHRKTSGQDLLCKLAHRNLVILCAIR